MYKYKRYVFTLHVFLLFNALSLFLSISVSFYRFSYWLSTHIGLNYRYWLGKKDTSGIEKRIRSIIWRLYCWRNGIISLFISAFFYYSSFLQYNITWLHFIVYNLLTLANHIIIIYMFIVSFRSIFLVLFLPFSSYSILFYFLLLSVFIALAPDTISYQFIPLLST